MFNGIITIAAIALAVVGSLYLLHRIIAISPGPLQGLGKVEFMTRP